MKSLPRYEHSAQNRFCALQPGGDSPENVNRGTDVLLTGDLAEDVEALMTSVSLTELSEAIRPRLTVNTFYGSQLRLRDGNGRIIGGLRDGSTVTFDGDIRLTRDANGQTPIGDTDNPPDGSLENPHVWFKIRTSDGRVGWASAEYLEGEINLPEPEPTPAPTQAPREEEPEPILTPECRDGKIVMLNEAGEVVRRTDIDCTPEEPVISEPIPLVDPDAFHFTSGMFEDGGRNLDTEFVAGRHNEDWLLDGQSPQQERILLEDNSDYADAIDALNYMGIDSLRNFDAINGTNYADQFETYATEILTNPVLFDDFIASLRNSPDPNVRAAFESLEPGINTMIRRQQELEYIKTLENWLLIEGLEASVLRGPTEIAGHNAANGYLGALYQMFAAEEASGTAVSINDILTRNYTLTELNTLLLDASGNPDTVAIAQFRHVQSQLRPHLANLQTIAGGTFADTIDAGGSVVSLQTQAIQRRWALAQYADERGGDGLFSGEAGMNWTIDEPAQATAEQMMQGLLLPMVDLPNLRTRFQEAFEAAESTAEADITESEVALALEQSGIDRSHPNYDTILQQALENSRAYEATQIKLEHILRNDGFDRATIDSFTGGNTALTDTYLEVVAEYEDTMGIGFWNVSDRTFTGRNVTGTAIEFGVIAALSATGFGLGAGAARAALLARGAIATTRAGRIGVFAAENMLGGGLGMHGGMSLAYGGLELGSSGDFGQAAMVFGDTISDRNLLVTNIVSGGTIGWMNRAATMRGSLLRGAGSAPLEATAIAGNPLTAETAEERREWGQQFMMSLMLNTFANQHMIGGAASRFSEAQTRRLGQFMPDRLTVPSVLRRNRIDLSRNTRTTVPHPVPSGGVPLEVNGVEIGTLRPIRNGNGVELFDRNGHSRGRITRSQTQFVEVDGVRVEVSRPGRNQPYEVNRTSTPASLTETLSGTPSPWIQKDRGVRYTTDNVTDGARQEFADPRGNFHYTRSGDELRFTLPDGSTQTIRNGDTLSVHGERVRFELDSAANQVRYTRGVSSVSNPTARLRRYWQRSPRVKDLSTPGESLNRPFSQLGHNTTEFRNLPDGTPLTFNRNGNLELQITRNGSDFTIEIDGATHTLNAANPVVNIQRARGLRPLTFALDGTNIQITRRLMPQAGRTTPIVEDLSGRTTGAVTSWQNLREGQVFRGQNIPPLAEFRWTVDGTPTGATKLSIRRNGTDLTVTDATGVVRTLTSGSHIELPNGRSGLTRIEWDGTNVQILRNRRAPRITAPQAVFEHSGGVLRVTHNLTAPGQTAQVTIPRGTVIRGRSSFRNQPIDFDGVTLTIAPDGSTITFTAPGRTRAITVGAGATFTNPSGIRYRLNYESLGRLGGANLRIDLVGLPVPPAPPGPIVPPVSGPAATRAFAGGGTP